MRQALLIIVIFFSVSAQALVYRSISPTGEVTYSDMPQTGAVEINAPPVNEVPSTMTPNTSGASGQSEDANASVAAVLPYTTFEIESPKDQDTIQNQPEFTVELHLEPALQAGDKVQLMLDDRLAGAPQTAMQVTLNNVDRGTHRLYAVILDKQNKIIKRTNEITIFVHRASVLHSQGAAVKTKKAPPSTLQNLVFHAKKLLTIR